MPRSLFYTTGAMLGALRTDLDEIDRDVRRAVVELERDVRPLGRLRASAAEDRAADQPTP